MLTPKQARFVAEYLIDLNATKAAERAGYSPRTANEQGARLLANASVSAAVAEAEAKQQERLKLSADEVREQNAFISRIDPAEMFAPDGTLLHVKDMPKHVRCAIKSVEVVKRNLTSGDGVMDTTYKILFWDKPKALEMEYKHFGLLTDRVEHSGEISISWKDASA